MKTFRGKKGVAILGIVALLILGAASYLIVISCASVEPGGNCSDANVVDYRYEAPPYTGNATVILGTDGYLWILGSGVRQGQSGCTATIEDDGKPVQWMPYPGDAPAFEDLRPVHVRGACLEGGIVEVPCNLTGVEKQDLLAVANMAYGEGYVSDIEELDGQPFYNATVLIMQLQQR